MIYVIMHGRLGNQMFQYAFAKKIQSQRNDSISIYFGKVEKKGGQDGWGNDLKYFKTGEYEIENNLRFLITKMSLKQKIALLSFLIKCRSIKNLDNLIMYQERMQARLNKLGLYWIRNGKFVPQASEEKNVFVCGHFEHYSLYKDMETELRECFTPCEQPLKDNESLYSIIDKTESVCISIRRGDFLDANNKDVYYVCDKNYFVDAIAKMKELIPSATLIVFSDDIKWVKDNWAFDGDVYYETENNPVWEKIRLMSSCKHFIISNSSFSWWVQYLSNNRSKVVISPSRWKNTSNYKGLIDPQFIKLNSDNNFTTT